MRSARVLSVLGATVSLAAASVASAPLAGAASSGIATNTGGTAVVSESFSSRDEVGTPNIAALNGHCTYARHAAGLEGSGIQFTIAGEATATGTYYGVPFVATGVECHLVKPDGTYVSGPEFLPGPAAATTRTITSMNAAATAVCVRAWGLLRQPVNGQTLISTTLQCR